MCSERAISNRKKVAKAKPTKPSGSTRLKLGRRTLRNLGAVAPGVADALVATAAALAVAIPAVFGYNWLANRLNNFDAELEGFGSELIALMVREGRI